MSGKRYKRSTALFEEWCRLPNVALEQASWLLLECDPWQPQAWDGTPADDLQIGMTQDEYCEAFRQEMQRRGAQTLWAPRAALVDDCRALNITFAKRSSKGSKDKSRRRRAG